MNGNDADANWWAICAGTKSGCNEENLADVLAAAAAAALSILSIQVWELNADLNSINLIMLCLIIIINLVKIPVIRSESR